MPSSRESSAWTIPGFGDAPPARPRDAGPAQAWKPDDLGKVRPVAPASPLDEAYARGFADGSAQGLTRAREEVRPAAEMLARVFAQLSDAAEEFAHDRERNLEGLAIAIARRIVQREVAIDATILHDLIARGLELLPHDAEVTVRIHPADLEALGDTIARISTPGRAVTLHWLTDPALERGSFTAESPQRMVDGRSDVALRTLYERLGNV